MANIFISSTYTDLKDYRERVSSVIRKMGHTDIAMEYYGAEDKRPLDKCLEDVDTCDLYIGIFAWRYGFIPLDHQESITELEYRKARESGKPCLIFLLKDDVPWSPAFIDENRAKINAFREELCANHVLDFFTSIDSLGEYVTEAIHKWEKNKSVLPITLQKGQELNIGAYNNSILKRYKILDLDALTPPEKADFMEIQLKSIFVEQDVRERPPPIEIPKELLEKLIKDEKLKEEDLPEGITLEGIKKAKEAYLEKPAIPVLDAIINPKNQFIVILGDPGSGKSILSRYLILSLITNEDDKLHKAFSGYLPLLIELRDYAAECTKNKCDTFIEYLDFLGKTKGLGLTKKALNNYLKNNGKAVVIFDGLDEIFDLDQRENIKKQIVALTIDFPKTKVIVTSRIVGYRRGILTNAGFSHYTLQDFQKLQIDAFIDKWYSIALVNNHAEARARKERINRSLDESTSIRQLAGNPLLLTIMAIINKHQELPRERWRLYEHASSVLIHHWDWERRIKEWNIKILYVSQDDKEELLRRIAYQMQSAPKGLSGNYIHAETLQAEFERYFIERYQRNPADAKLASQVLIEQLRERNFILCRYGSNLYGFIHRTFLEYFCAWTFVWKFNVKHEFNLKDLKSIFNEHWNDESWHEVLRLICGMIDEKFAERLIEHLIDVFPPDMSDFYGRDVKYVEDLLKNSKIRPPQNIDLAVKCMGELKNLELIKNTSSKLLEKTCELISLRLKYYYFPEFVEKNLVPSAISIGKRWAGREKLANWISKLATENIDTNKHIERYFWSFGDYEYIGKFIGSIGVENESIRDSVKLLLKNNNLIFRGIALTALVSGWHDNSTLKLLQHHALKDKDEKVRNKAVSLIGQGWWHGDLKILEMLQNYLLRNKSPSVRRYAIHVISEGWYDNPHVFFFLCDLAKSAEEFSLRQFAIQHVGKIWKNDIKALELLEDRAINDTYSGVREAALSMLDEQWKDDPMVLNILRERASKEPNPAIREIIYKIFTKKEA